MTSISPVERVWRYALGVAALLAIWSALAAYYPTVLVPSPLETAQALAELASSGELFRQAGVSLARILIAFGISVLVGGTAGLLVGFRPRWHPLIQPAVSLAMSAPPISWLVLALVWFGTGSVTPIFTSVVVSAPVVFANVYEGVRALDPDLLAMARAYGARGRTLFEDVYLPALTPHLFAGLQVAASLSVRVGIMGELLGSDAGVGYALALSRIYLETPRVFAWVLVTVTLLALLEAGLVRTLQRRAEAWKRAR
jgi:NitT/TauT family transport system permease protein